MSGSYKMALTAAITIGLWITAGLIRPGSARAEKEDFTSARTKSAGTLQAVSPEEVGSMLPDDLDNSPQKNKSGGSWSGRAARELRDGGWFTDKWFRVRESQVRTAAMVLIFVAAAALLIGLLFMSYESGVFKAAPTGGWLVVIALMGLAAAQLAVIVHAVAPAWAAAHLPVKSPCSLMALTLAVSAIGIIISNYVLMKSNSLKGPGAFWYRLGAPLGLLNLTLAIIVGWWAYRGGNLPLQIF